MGFNDWILLVCMVSLVALCWSAFMLGVYEGFVNGRGFGFVRKRRETRVMSRREWEENADAVMVEVLENGSVIIEGDESHNRIRLSR